jgi:hypothetical protein
MTHSKSLTRLALLILVSIGLPLFSGIASARTMPGSPTRIDVQVTPTKLSPETPGADPTPEETATDPQTLLETDLVWVLVGVVALAGLLLATILTIYFLRRARRRPQKPTPPPPTPSTHWPCLEIPGAPEGSCHLRLKPDNNTIGRDPRNDIVIAQNLPGWDTVSPQHARIYRQDGRWILEDLDSMNGVYVNGQRTGRNLLHEGYRIGIGGVDFIFHLTSEPASQENEYAMS